MRHQILPFLKRIILFGFSLFLFAGNVFSQNKAALFRRSEEPLPIGASKGLSKGQRLIPSGAAIKEIYNNEPESFSLEIPLNGGETKELVFYRKRVVSSDFRVTTSDGKEFRGKEFSGVHYQIRPGLQNENVGGLSFTETEVSGVFSDEKGNWNIGPLPESKGDYIVYCEKDLLVQSGFNCETPDSDLKPEEPKDHQKHGGAPSVESTGSCKVVKMYFECDFKMYQDNGSSTASTTTRITSMFNMVQQMYINEQINIELDQVFVWTTTDPYATMTPSNTVLSAFTNNRQAITQKLGHLVSTRAAGMGGIAWLDVVCNPSFYNYRYGFSNIYNSFSAVPTYSWSVYCLTHEIGHNFGSKHTHWCGWTGGAIDNCYATEPNNGVSCSTGPAVSGGGTIMSYCHLTASGINFSKGFGTQPGAKIRSGFSCITGSPVPSFSLGGPSSVCSGDNINLTLSTTTSGAVFNWTGPNGFSSNQQNPVVNSASTASSGAYSCTVAASACTSSAKTINVVVNTPSSPPLSEGFSSTFPPSSWRLVNPNSDVTWIKNTTTGGFGTSTSCMSIDNYNLPFTTGKKDTMFLPVVNFSGQTGASMTFDVAHAWNGSSHDSLSVLVSTNCGKSFKRVYKKSGSALATAPNTFGQFTPTATQWRKETINLGAYDGLGQVQIAFANFSGSTNILYIDNINITSAGGGGNSISLAPLTQSAFCPGEDFSVGFTPTGTFNSGNSFTVQMSNSTGSFTSPTVIGTGSSSPVSVLIPAAATSGSGYLLRVVASSPSTTSPSSSAFSITPLSVNAGSDKSLCANDASITLVGSPAGGTWSGSGVSSSGVFTPSASLVGNRTLTYSASSGSCSGTDVVVVTVKSVPTVNAGIDISTCSGAAAFALTGFSPSGGTWSGAGVSSSGTFTPSVSLLGANSLTYSFTSNGCTNTDVRVVTVSQAVVVSAGTYQPVCSNASPITLSGSPSGGTWAGSGVSPSGVFTPNNSLVGANVLTYTVSGACAGNAQTTVTVTAAPVVSAGIARTFCETDSAITLNQGTPAGGTWSGTGVSSGSFSPSAAGPGTFTLKYLVTAAGCSDSSTVQFTVNASPTVTASPSQTVCSNNPAFSLSGTPSGGTWSGSGVSGSGVFTPSSALVGTQTLTYSVTVAGCSGSAISSVTVNTSPVANAGADQNVVATSPEFPLTGTPSGGVWSGTPSNIITSSGVFSPQNSGEGSFTVTYTVTSNACTDSDQTVILVSAAATVSAGTDVSICTNGNPLQLNGIPSGGTWSGNGVSSTGIFTPSASLIGLQNITYTVAGVGSDQVVVTVLALPVVDAGFDQSICSSIADFSLNGTPAGGTWSGTGISSAGLVSVSTLSSGVNTLTYTASESACSNSDIIVVTKVSPPVVNAGANQSLCVNASPVQLSGSPAGGVWSGTGVSSSGLFDPSSGNIGANTLTYTVDGSIPSCQGSDQVVITIKTIPVVTAGADRITCANASPFLLSASPVGGSWSGSGVSGPGLFSPTSGLVGINQLIYSATQNGCSAKDTLIVTVNSVPAPNAGSDFSICTNGTSFNLSGFSPAGGVWSGPSFLSQSGQCTGPFSNGTYTLTYTLTADGCTGSDQLILSVTPAPTVNAGSNKTVCANASDLTLTGFTPAGGVWSGNGVTPQGVFSPSSSLVGTQTLTYSVLSGGCSGSDQITVTVKTIPVVSPGADESACASGIRFKINGYSPRGGKWTGPGVVLDSLFQPTQALSGAQTLTYSVTKNGCSNSAQKVVTVNSSNNLVPDAGNPSAICANATAVPLLCSPSGGVWKGNGVSANGLFTPSTALVGNRILRYRLDLNGCRDSVDVPIQVNAVPVVNAGLDISACSQGTPVALSGYSPAGGSWSGSGVSASGIFTPTSVSPGNITLTYSFTENGCSGSDELVINVSSSPPVNAGLDKTICRNSESIQIVASPIGGTWSGTGISSTGLFTPSAGMGSPLTLTYTLNQNGCTGTDEIVVNLSADLVVNAGTDQSICSNQAAFNLSGSSPAGGTWSGTGVSAAGLFTPSAGIVGSQTLTYKITQPGCVVSNQKIVQVKAVPVVSAGIDQTICSNEINPTLSSFSPAGGTWSGTGVNAAGVINTAQSGSFTVTYSVTQNACTAVDQKLLSIVTAPVVEAGPNQNICGIVPAFSLSGFSPAGGTWSGNGVNAAGLFTPQTSMVGTSVNLVYSLSQNGCTDTDTTRILVINIPTVVTVTSTVNQACQGALIPLGLNLGGSTSSFLYQWKKDGNDLPGANAASYDASLSGVYKAVVSLASCSVSSQEKTLVFNPLPATPVITQANLVLSSSSATGNQWKRNGQNIAGANQQTHTVTLSGIYTVVVSSQNCLSAPSNSIVIDLTPNADLLEGIAEIKLFPNPARDKIFLTCENCNGSKFSLRLLDATGRSLREFTGTIGGGEIQELDIRNLPSGVYWVRSSENGMRFLKKIMIE